MLQKPSLRLSVVALSLSTGLLVQFWPAQAAGEGTILVQAPPAAKEPPVVLPPDDGNPLLTPEIRPRGQTPELKPDTPERKAEPKALPPERKDSTPAPRPDAQPDKSDPKAPQQKAEPKKSDPKGPDSKSAKKAPDVKPGLAVAQPRTAAEREKALSDLYAYLAAAEDAKQATTISTSIERLWVTSGSDTVGLLMQRAMQAVNGKNPDLALKLLDAVVALAPDYAEGWNRRAYVHYTQSHIDLALGDLRRTLALDPNHFKALEGLVHILRDIGRKKEALQAARTLLDVNPYYDGMKQIVDELAREIEGRGI